jgi:hypothetical protein
MSFRSITEDVRHPGGEGDARDRWIRALGSLGVGVLLALGVSLIQGLRGEATHGDLEPAGPVAWWAVDRDAQELCGLDEELRLTRRVHMGWPLAVRSRRDGGAWVLRSSLGKALQPCRLDRIRADGSTAIEIDLGPSGAFALLDAGDALVVEKGTGRDGADKLLRCEDDGAKRVLLEAADISCVADTRAFVLAGTARSEILRFRSPPDNSQVERVALDGALVDLAPGPDPGTAWLLLDQGGARLALLGPDLALRWTTPTGLRCVHVAPVEGEERVWIGDTERPLVRRFGPGGALELDQADLPLAGFDRVVAWEEGSVLLVAPGAILRLDRRGRMMPGQGGFDYLTDLERAHVTPK